MIIDLQSATKLVETLCTSVLPRYLSLGGPLGLIHWKMVAAWLKIKDLSEWMLMLTSRTRYFRDKITQ